MRKQRQAHGFTLVELIVVASILAVLAGMILFSFNRSLQDDSANIAARLEMQSIREALITFRLDNQTFPTQTSAADVSFLYEQGSLSDWDADYSTGWRGPYLSGGDTGLVDIGDDLQLDGSGLPYAGNAVTLQRAIPDPNYWEPVSNGESQPFTIPCVELTSNDQCLLDWRFVGQSDSDEPIEKYGRPYLFFDLDDTTKARIVSMGINGEYESTSVTTCENKFTDLDDNDDLVLCIF